MAFDNISIAPVSRWVREQAIPQITRSLDSGEIAVAFRLLRRADALLPDDPALRQIHRDISVPTSFSTNPPGAEVWATGYAPDDNDWVRLGVTPFTSRELPFGIYRFRIVKPGFQTVLGSGEVRAGTQLQFDLDPDGFSRRKWCAFPAALLATRPKQRTGECIPD